MPTTTQETPILCSACNKEEEIFKTEPNDGPYCEECWQEAFYSCDNCSESIPQDGSFYFKDSIYCESCLNDISFICYRCDERASQNELLSIGNYDYCQKCYDNNFFNCESCGEDYSNDDYYGDGECIHCHDREDDEDNSSGSIHDSQFMPSLIFSKMPWENTRFQGIELEIEVNSSQTVAEHAEKFIAFLAKEGMDKYLYLKHDGSVSHGYEIVSHPFTSTARNRQFNWHKVLKFLRETKCKAFKAPSCGLHIHVSRQSLTDEDICKLKRFFSIWKGNIEKIAGREGNSYCEYENYSISALKARQVYTDCRYKAINVVNGQSNKKTVEFRIFKATINFPRFMACLQFADAICEFVKAHGVTLINSEKGWIAFKEFVRRENKYNWLEKHFKTVHV